VYFCLSVLLHVRALERLSAYTSHVVSISRCVSLSVRMIYKCTFFYLFICIYLYMCLDNSISVCIYTYKRLSVHTCVCFYAYILYVHTHTNIFLRICMVSCLLVCLSGYVVAWLYGCMAVNMYVCTSSSRPTTYQQQLMSGRT
jgi:hypothetical protein